MEIIRTIKGLRVCLSGLGLILFLAGTFPAALGQEPALRINYHLAMSRPNSHLFEVSIAVEMPTSLESLDFQMPIWSPGRYAVFDFAKNVQEFRVAELPPPRSGCEHAAAPVTRVDTQTWRLFTCGADHVTVSYKVFANDLSGTFSQLDSQHANFNGGCVFMYVVNHKPDPVKLTIDPPKGWRIVNGRMDRPEQREWVFPDWDIMIDTPTEIAPDWTMDDFEVDGKHYHVMVHSLVGNEGGKRPALVLDIQKIVRAETAMWGAPEFDSYTFLIHFAADDHSSDGMEHLTSTQVIMPGKLGDPGVYEATLDAIAHEFFHVWNVKRLRPIELGPWDFTKPANTRGLWIAEGFTNYYGHLMQRRAGLWDDAQFLRTMIEYITEIENAPGSRLMSAEDSSLSAPFIDDAPHAQQTNLANSSISYYSRGELLALVLDLLIRGKTKGQASLDDVMRRAYEEFYLKSPNATYYLRGRGYRNEDFERVASEVAGRDLGDFFKRYAQGVESPPYDEALAQVGLRLVREPRQPVSIGISAEADDASGRLKIGGVRPDSPAEEAGLADGDIIVSFGGLTLTSANWLKTLSRYKPGDRVEVAVQRDRNTIKTSITLGQPEVFNYRIEEIKNAAPEAKALRAAWLGQNRLR
jgi:predicted metalloprotease with PDZ domain